MFGEIGCPQKLKEVRYGIVLPVETLKIAFMKPIGLTSQRWLLLRLFSEAMLEY
jgi:hypothetical protein